MMPPIIHVAIVDDHQTIIDGYLYRLQNADGIEVVGTTYYGEEIEPLLERCPVDVLLLDAQIPTSKTNPANYPVLVLLPRLLKRFPDLNVLIISGHKQPAFIEFAMDAGAGGYVVKGDYGTVSELEAVIRTVASGGLHFSKDALQPWLKPRSTKGKLTHRQLEALALCVAYPNETTHDLAERLDVADSTMRNLLSGAYMRLKVNNRAAAVAEAQRRGLLLSQE